MKVLNVSHGHPEDIRGGAEVASHTIHRELERRPDVESCLLTRAADGHRRHLGTPFLGRPGAPGEVAFQTDSFDYFLLSNRRQHELTTHFEELLRSYRPDIVHFHHYFKLGLELIRVTRNVLPTTAIFVTLYEYLAICHNNGQMVKTDGQTLCYRASARDCSNCFPDRSPQDFYLRERFVKAHLSHVDRFVASSHFILERHLEWGLPVEKTIVVDNGFERAEPLPPRPTAAGEGRGRFAFFGQLNRWKGVLLLLEAFAELSERLPPSVTLDVHGANLEIQPTPFREELERLVSADRRVRFHGSYHPRELSALMSEIDWVVVPSIWWENSPLVIQEAFLRGRPVIASDIGGMAEKVKDGHNGLTFGCGSSRSLARTLTRAATLDGLWSALRFNIRSGPWIDDVVDVLLTEYRSVLREKRRRSARPAVR